MMALFFQVSLREKEIAETQEMGALVEPPIIQIVQSVGRLEGPDCQWQDEIVEQEIDREFKHRSTRRPIEGKNAVGSKMQAPYNPAEKDDHQSTVNQGTKPDLAELSSNAALEDIANGMECWIIRITNEICGRNCQRSF